MHHANNLQKPLSRPAQGRNSISLIAASYASDVLGVRRQMELTAIAFEHKAELTPHSSALLLTSSV